MFYKEIVLFFLLKTGFCDDCGPLGFDAKNLLRPAYWFFDLPAAQCPTKPEDHMYKNETRLKEPCRIYFNLCKNQRYQCSGAVCARYGFDLVTNLGQYEAEAHPFHEAKGQFVARYTGERLMCGTGTAQVKTSFKFVCNTTAFWNNTNDLYHGGSKVLPTNLWNSTFNNQTCEFDVLFKSAEACPYYPSNDSPTEPMSYGSIILILFFPGVALYFILGCLFNRMKGFEGKDMIPHQAFLVDLPELIMDGFLFSMATITCKHEDRFAKEYEPVA